MSNTQREYIGYLSGILRAPDRESAEGLPQVLFTAEDIAEWPVRGLAGERAWQSIPAYRGATEDAVRFTARFQEVTAISQIRSDDLQFWASLGTVGLTDVRLPIDLEQYPIAEFTYRCITPNAVPGWTLTYPGGTCREVLSHAAQWRTAVRLIPHRGYPKQVNDVVIRLYSGHRTTEIIEVRSVRFRAMTPGEAEAVRNDTARLSRDFALPAQSGLDDFIPIGVCMDMAWAIEQATMLGVTQDEFWALTFEDFIKHHHNCAMLDKADALDDEAWQTLLRAAEKFDIRLVPAHAPDLDPDSTELDALIESRIRPAAATDRVVAWSVCDDPQESTLPRLLRARQKIERASPRQPLAVIARHPSPVPCFAPNFAICGAAQFMSHLPWETGELVRAHASLAPDHRFWFLAPAFVHASGLPEWSSYPEIRLMVNSAFANGAGGWFSYAFHNKPYWMGGRCQRTLTGPFLTFSDLWLELDKPMAWIDAMAPMLVLTHPAPLPKKWFVHGRPSEDHSLIAEGAPPISSCRLRGPNYNLYFLISNDVRGMASVNIDIPPAILGGLQIYDLTDCIHSRQWRPMELTRHIEMYPGHTHVVLVAEPDTCAHWRDVIVDRLIVDDRRQLRFDLELAQRNSLSVGEIEALLNTISVGHGLDDLLKMDRARELLVNLVYRTPEVADTRTRIIEVNALVCGCDGALCRLKNKGKAELAAELGEQVLPLAREFTRLRLRLRHGEAKQIVAAARDLCEWAKKILAEIRKHA